MKKIFVFIVLSTLLFFGCSDLVTNANDPVSNASGKLIFNNSEKISMEFNRDDSANVGNDSSYSLLELPKTLLGIKLQLFVSKNIIGSAGGSLEISQSYLSTSGLITILSNLSFPEGAFPGTKNITMNANKNYAFLDCGPHMVFDKPVILNSTYIGLNLSFLSQDINNISFSYITTDGKVYPVENEGIEVNPALGLISVKNAKIHHFTRYGWTRKR